MTTPKPSASVLGAAIVAILASALAVLSILLTLASLLLVPQSQSTPELPATTKTALQIMMLVGLGFAALGVATGINLIRLKNLARLSALVWAGITVVLGNIALIFVLALPFPMPAGGPPVNPQYIKALVVTMYAIPILIGVWSLILFNRRGVKAQFKGNVLAGEAQSPGKPRCPLPLAVTAGFLLLSTLGMFAMPLLHLPIISILFGHRLRGELGTFVFATSTILYLAAAIGLLALKRWSYPLILGLSIFWLLSGFVSFLSPNFGANMQELLSEMNSPETSAAVSPFLQNRAFAILALLPSVGFLGFLIYYRKRFLHACETAEAAK
jgi:hypothetical protein